ncbi:MAG: hypothetical protein AAF633_24975, partial [Chloroflexota bacterium]
CRSGRSDHRKLEEFMLGPLIQWIQCQFQNLLILIVRGVSVGLWYVEKVIAWLADQIVSGDIWDTIVEGLLTGMGESMPTTLRSVMFGTGGGIFYLAIMFLGLIFIMPHLMRESKMMELPRVLGWAIFITALFISSTAGYDLIAMIEGARMEMMTTVAGVGGAPISSLVGTPMSATEAEINVTEFALPAAYQDEYFPDPTGFETLELVFYDNFIMGSNTATLLVEEADSLAFRQRQALLGMVLVILNIIPTGMVLILMLSFAALTAGSLVLIIFFVICLPAGLFEIGMEIVKQVIGRYVLVWVVSLLLAIFPSAVLGLADITLTPPVTLTGLFTYVGVLLVAVYATFHVARWVVSIFTESFLQIGHSINAALIPYAYGGYGERGYSMGGVPRPDQLPPRYAMGTVGAAAAVGAVGAAPPYTGPRLHDVALPAAATLLAEAAFRRSAELPEKRNDVFAYMEPVDEAGKIKGLKAAEKGKGTAAIAAMPFMPVSKKGRESEPVISGYSNGDAAHYQEEEDES